MPADTPTDGDMMPPATTVKPPNLVETSWDEFASAGLFWWINRGIHLFGWALVREMDSDEPDAKVLRVYPARCRFRGFSEDVEDDGFRRLTADIEANIPNLVRDTSDTP